MGRLRSQSAMEYLMTYGWAILVIAVVLGVLFQLGVFGDANLAPKATPGSCEVQRTVAGSSLAGMCQGELPEYVAQLSGSNELNTNNIYIQQVSGMSGSNVPFTLTGWVEIPLIDTNPNFDWMEPFVSFNYQGAGIFNYTSSPSTTVTMVLHRCTGADTCTSGVCGGQSSYSSKITQTLGSFFGKWHFFAYSSDPPSYFFQLDNQTAAATNGNPTSWSNGVYIGGLGGACGDSSMKGFIANIQLYNTTLSTAEVQALYQEGIGGAPVRPQNIVGWWPLNGNLNDYSGNSNDGQAQGVGVGYTSFWSSGYTAP